MHEKVRNFFARTFLFLGGVVAGCCLPFLPLLFEFIVSNTVTPSTWAISAAMFSIGISLNAKHQALTIAYNGITVVMSFVYGVSFSELGLQDWVTDVTIWIAAAVFLFHAVERFSKHFIEGRPIFSFRH